MADMVNHPPHYCGDGEIECADFISVCVSPYIGDRAFFFGNTIKYLWRWKNKGGIEDLKKAQWYLKRGISTPGLQMHVSYTEGQKAVFNKGVSQQKLDSTEKFLFIGITEDIMLGEVDKRTRVKMLQYIQWEEPKKI